MTYVVSHFLIPVFILIVVRKAFPDLKKTFTNHAVFLGGFFGMLPDLDILLVWSSNIINHQPLSIYHRFFFHNVFLIIAFALIALIFYIAKKKKIYYLIFALLAFGFSIHILIDSITGESMLFYPFISDYFGFRLLHIGRAGYHLTASIDAFLFLCLLSYLTIKGKIKNLI